MWLGGADLTGIAWPEANLHGASLNGASLCEANLQGANLRSADLRGVRFDYLAGSRGGLVGSTIASEGSRTGFYAETTLDDLLQSSEMARIATFCDADLRGADLTGAKLLPRGPARRAHRRSLAHDACGPGGHPRLSTSLGTCASRVCAGVRARVAGGAGRAGIVLELALDAW